MQKVKILLAQPVTHDVKRFITEKPAGYKFTPGQATEVAINLPNWQEEKRPFTFTSLGDDRVLEFIIKGYPVNKYPNHNGMTEKLHTLKPGDELLINKPWGTINYQGPGVFIAGGAGITPFIAIFRDLYERGEIKGNDLIFSNKEARDVILEKELRFYFGERGIFTLTREEVAGYEWGHINKEFLTRRLDDFSQNFYLCGPPKMVASLKAILKDLGASAESLVFEE